MKSLSTLESHGLTRAGQAGQTWGTLSRAVCLHGCSEATLSLEEVGVRGEEQGLMCQEGLGARKPHLLEPPRDAAPFTG